MPIDPMAELELGAVPGLAQPAQLENLRRRLERLELSIASQAAYASGDYFTWNGAGFTAGDGKPSAQLFVRDDPRLVVDVLASVRARVNAAPNQAVARLSVTDGLITVGAAPLLTATGLAYTRWTTLQGSQAGTQGFDGGWRSFPTSVLKDGMGMTLDRVLTFSLQYASQPGGVSEWEKRELWLRVR